MIKETRESNIETCFKGSTDPKSIFQHCPFYDSKHNYCTFYRSSLSAIPGFLDKPMDCRVTRITIEEEI